MMNNQSSSSTLINLAFILAGTASISFGGVSRVPPLPSANHNIEKTILSPIRYGLRNDSLTNFMKKDSSKLIEMEIAKKLRIKIMRSSDLDLI